MLPLFLLLLTSFKSHCNSNLLGSKLAQCTPVEVKGNQPDVLYQMEHFSAVHKRKKAIKANRMLHKLKKKLEQLHPLMGFEKHSDRIMLVQKYKSIV